MTIAIACQLQHNQLVLKTWFPVRDKNVRKGLLIRRGQ